MKIFIGNLDEKIQSIHLKEAFQEYGEVSSAKVVTDRKSGKSKGFGFIKDTETQESVFVHANNLLEEIKDNNVVSYEVEMGPKGPSAVRVKILR